MLRTRRMGRTITIIIVIICIIITITLATIISMKNEPAQVWEVSYSSSLAHIYFSGYSVSLAALTTALLIFAYFKFVVFTISRTFIIILNGRPFFDMLSTSLLSAENKLCTFLRLHSSS